MESRLELSGDRSSLPASPTQTQATFATVGMALLGPVVGSALARLLLPNTPWSQALGFFALSLVFMFGYKVWMARLAAIAWKHLTSGFLRAIWHMVVRRTRPNPNDVLPTREKLQTMMNAALTATGVFFKIGILFGLLNAVVAGMLAEPGMALLSGSSFFVASAAYGYALTHLGRTGYLVFPEPA